ncbi:MAG: AMP-binding protein, partial [Bacteroidales bacterium]|nr:AMP-binding protein [Bacteroidales bacterium]
MNIFDYFFEDSKDLSKDIVLGPREQISYKNLYENCLNLSKEIGKNYGVNNNILILSENSVFFITTYLAILKSGNTCVPLNPNIEKENFENILNRTESLIMFISKRFEQKYSNYQLEIVGDEQVNNWIESGRNIKDTDITDSFNENKIAEIIFTSGSTGEQKGVMITHKNIIANTDSIIEYLKLTSSYIIQVVMPFYYCYGLSLLHTHLKVGGSVVLNNSFIFLGSVINDLKKYECTGFAGVPSHFQILL